MSIHAPPVRQLDLLRDKEPAYLNTSPANAMSLASFVARAGMQPPAILALLTVGEYVSDDLRQECRQHLGCEIIDVFSTAECGVIATQCPEDGGYHMQPELTVLEIRDDAGRPCGPGKTGRVTATPLYNYAMPLVRYQSEDFVTVGGNCSCGRAAPVLSKILGRANHHFLLPDGRRVRPEPSSEELRKFIGFRRWQLAQTSLDRAEFRVAASPAADPLNAAAAGAYISSLIGSDIAVQVLTEAILGPTSGGKFANVVCETAADGAGANGVNPSSA
jgi:phenylacetate-CoA ligase